MAKGNASNNGNRSRGRGRMGGAAAAVLRTGVFQPAQIDVAPVARRTMRYIATAASNLVVTRACLLSLCAASNGGAAVLTPLWSSVRIKALRTWSIGGAVGDMSVAWESDVGLMRSISKSVINQGPVTPLRTSPPAGSRSAMWSRANALAATLSEILFTVDYNMTNSAENPVQMYLELDLEVNSSDEMVSSLTTSAVPTGGAGIYYMALDSLTTSNTVGNWDFYPSGFRTYNSTPATFTRTG